MWGFITCLNDLLIPYLKGAFNLNYTQAMLIQFCFFGAYFIASLPAGWLVGRIGFKSGIVVGLSIACIGCLLFLPAAALNIYAIFLLALFVLATGITVLQVSANPYVTALGDPKTASSRLTLTQAFNSLGTTLAPLFGSWLLFSELEHTGASADAVRTPYLLLAVTLAFLALIFMFLKLPSIIQQNKDIKVSLFAPMAHKHLSLGMLGIFVYVGAEVAIGSLIVNYIQEASGLNLTEKEAASYLTYYWGGAMVGRFVGAFVMQKLSAHTVLCFNAAMASLLIMVSLLTQGQLAMWSLLAVGLCNSIMFPTIFSLALQDLKEQTSQGSGLLCLAIVGGAIIPLFQGYIADTVSLTVSFVLPISCYLYIAYYGVFGSRVSHE
jgi:FHS family L-fucose permease-like MFS transporter